MNPDTARTLKQFKGEKCKTGLKPLLSFSGTPFDSPTPNAYTLAKNMFTDFFRGSEVKEIDAEGATIDDSFHRRRGGTSWRESWDTDAVLADHYEKEWAEGAPGGGRRDGTQARFSGWENKGSRCRYVEAVVEKGQGN